MKKDICIRGVFIFLFCASVVLLIGVSCAPKLSEEELKIISLEKELEKKSDDLALVEELIHRNFNVGKPDKVVSIYEKYSDSFKDNPDIQVYYGAALCQKAGATEKIEDKLSLVKKGMIKLDDLVKKYPENSNVYLFRGITYSNLPSVLGARSIAEQDLDLCVSNFRSGKWKFPEEALANLYQGFFYIALEYNDASFIKKKYEELKKDIPNEKSWVYKYYASVNKQLAP